jgi:hypothetical protein
LYTNLKDERNAGLRESVLSGEMAPDVLCKKTSSELAPAELAQWRKARAEKYFSENVITEEMQPVIGALSFKKINTKDEISSTVSGPMGAGGDTGDGPDSAGGSGDNVPHRKKAKFLSYLKGQGESPIGSGLGGTSLDEQDRSGSIDLFPMSEEPLLAIDMGPDDLTEPGVNGSTLTSRQNRSSGTGLSSVTGRRSSMPASPLSSASSSSSSSIIWQGCLDKANMERCYVTASNLAGPHTTSIQHLLPQHMQVQGRVDLNKLSKYMTGLATSRRREYSLLLFEPKDEASSMPYVAMLHYFATKNRAGVVVNLNGAVKEMYIIPLTDDDRHFAELVNLKVKDKLIGLLVCEKGKQ